MNHTKSRRRASFRYYLARKWTIRGECEGVFLLGGAVTPITLHAPRGWKARAWTRDGSCLRVDIIANAFVSIPHAPADETVTYELTPRR